MCSKKVGKCHFLSFRRKPESRKNNHFWTPAFAGVTALVTFYEAVNPTKYKMVTVNLFSFFVYI